MSSPVFITASGLSPVSRQPTPSLRELARPAITTLLDSCPPGFVPDALICGTMLSGQLSGQQQVAPLLAADAGFEGIEAWTVEAACASGGAAIIAAMRLLSSGEASSVLVVGIERMAHVPVDEATAGLATAADRELESARGETFVSLNARLLREWSRSTGTSPDDLAPFAILAHQNALSAEHACFRKAITEQAYLTSRLLDPPLRLLDACPICDGAAAILLTTKAPGTEGLLATCSNPVRISGAALRTDTTALAQRRNLLALSAAPASLDAALRLAGRTRAELDFFEVHDAYTSMAAIALEANGFCPPGTAATDARNGRFSLDGDLPISTFGGLKARGHPVGATGVYQAAEAFMQLTGTAGANQVNGARVGLAQNIGGAGTTVTSLILERT